MSRLYDSLRRAPSNEFGLDMRALTGIGDIPQIPVETPATALVGAAISAPEVSAANVSVAPVAAAPPPAIELRIPDQAPLFPYDGTNPYASEQYRILRTKILQHAKQPRSIVISSAGPGDGKTTTAINLSAAFALRADVKVLLVDGDFRRSSISPRLGLPEEPGLANVLSGACTLEAALVRAVQIPNLYVLRAGKSAANPSELLDSPAWTALNQRCRQMFKYVIYDSPPVAAVADFDLIQAACDAIVLVARQDHTKRVMFLETLKRIPKDRLLGVVLNSVEDWLFHRGSQYGAYTYYGHTPGQTAKTAAGRGTPATSS